MIATQDALFETEERCPICGDVGRIFDPKIGAMRMCECRSRLLAPPDQNPDAPAGIESRDDEIRLNKQQARVWAVMKDESWHTLPELAERTGDPEASISARLRDLRKYKYGGHELERDHLGSGLYRYRLTINRKARMVP
jgi:hypothetical protein